MKTKTRSKIVDLIQKGTGKRPVELVRRLGISPQAIHRHLRTLVTEGLLERRGRGPKTRYFAAGSPGLDTVRRWYTSISGPVDWPVDLVCETRDAFIARLSRLKSFAGTGLGDADLPLAISVAGEVGNNCFDHNLGSWQDVPGCWWETQATGGRLWMCIADRGQGVFRSLTRADPTLPDEQSALVAAFEKIISGRAPESRGNGLKFVRNIIVANERRGLACRSGAGLVDYGRLGPDCRKELADYPSRSVGTITLILWSMQ